VSRLKRSKAQLSGIGAWMLGIIIILIILIIIIIIIIIIVYNFDACYVGAVAEVCKSYKRRLSRHRAVSLISSS